VLAASNSEEEAQHMVKELEAKLSQTEILAAKEFGRAIAVKDN